MVNTSTSKVTFLGAVAGMLALLTFIALVYLAIIVFTLLFTTMDQLAQAQAEGTLLTDQSLLVLFGERALSSGQNALYGLWQARFGFVVFAILGVLAAIADLFGREFSPKRPWLSSLICMGVIIVFTLVAWIFTQREAVLLWMAEAPELYQWRDFLIQSYTTDIFVGVVFGLALTYPIWAVWRWWYTKLGARWVVSPTLDAPAPKPHSAMATRRSYAARLAELKHNRPAATSAGQTAAINTERIEQATSLARQRRLTKLILPLIALLLLCLAILFPLQAYYNQVAIRLQHGRTFTDVRNESHQVFEVDVQPNPYRLRIVNIKGMGTVDLFFSPSEDYEAAVGQVTDWSFEWRSDDYLYAEIPVEGVDPGRYYLHILQKDGWGFFEYTLSHGGGQASYLAALGIGFLLACCVVLIFALSFLTTIRLRHKFQP